MVLVLAGLLLWAGAPAADAGPAVPEDAVAVQRAGARALFFGDSYFVGGGCSPDRRRGMARVAGAELGYRTIIRGAGGTGFVAANRDYGIPAYLAQIRAGAFDVRNPRLVVIEGGSNDVGRPVRKIRRNAKKVLLIAERRFPSARLVLVGPMQTYGPWSDTNRIKRSLRSLARGLGVRFVNPQRWTSGHDEWLCDDYVHPTYAGHQILGHRLAVALKRRGA